MASGKEKLNETTLPAHPAQQGLLLATSVGGAAVNCTCAYTIRGPLDSGQLADAYRNALGAFDALRIEWEAWTSGGRWRSVSEPRFEVRQEDVRDQRLTDGGRPGPLLRSRVQHSADRILSASRGPLAVIELLRTEPDVWTVVETIDHSVADGRSLAVLHAAVANIYQRPGGAHFTAPSYQAVLAAAKQPRPESRHYWKQAFAGFDLPAPTAAHSANGTIWQTTVDAENARMLRRAAGKLRGTLAGALLASHGHAIARHTGTGDIATFVAVDGRNAGNFDMFGQLTSLLPARLRHRWHAELGLHITEATRQLLAMREHLDLDVGVLDELGVPVSIARPESTAFIMQSQSDPVIDLPGISVQAVGLRSSDQAGGLVTVASHYPDGTIDITMRAPSGSIYASHISSIGETFHETLQAIVANPAIRLGSDRLLPPPTRTLIEQLAIPEAPFPFSPIDGDILANLVADGRRPVLRDAGRTYTAAELLRSVRSCQARLVDGGVAAGVAVSVGELPTFERIAAFVAILTLGAIYVPFDGAADSADVRHTERRCQAAARITAGGLVNLRAHDAHVPPAVADANDPAYVIFTSGTSGEPKGVVVSRQSLANLVRGEGQRFGIGVGSNVLLIAPPTVDPWICHVTAALLHQATLVRIDATSDGRLADRIAASRITHAFLPAALVRLLTGVNLPDLQMLASAGDHCRAADLTTFLGRRIFNIYGPTETTVTATVAEITDFTDPVPIGSPIRGFGARVLIDGMASAPPGVCGELALSGAGVAIGYLGDDVRTEARFRRDVLDPGDRYYLTGDIAWLRPDGQLVITGRVDRQVKVRGTRVEPEAVESAALSTGHCSDAFLHAFTPSGSPDKQLTLFVAGCQDVAALVAVLRAKVARPAWPHHVVALDEIPRRASGKVADELLPTDYRRGGQAAPAVQLAAQPDPLAAAWIEVLGAAPTADDDFFAMGGDSLNVLRLVRHARGSGLSLSPADVYRYPRFGELRRQCTTQSPGPDQVPTFRPHARTIPVGPAQQWFLNMVFAAPREWQQRHTIQLAVLPSAERLGDALTALTAATPLLRSAFDPESLLFRVGKLQPLRVEVLDASLPDLQIAEAIATLHSLVDPYQGRMLAGMAIRDSDGSGLVVLAAHHLVVDVWSWNVITDRLKVILDGAVVEDDNGFAAFANAVRRQLAAGAFALDAPWWDRVLAAGRTGDVAARPQRLDRLVASLGNVERLTRAWRLPASRILPAALGHALSLVEGPGATVVDVERNGRNAVEDLDLSTSVGWFALHHPLVVDHAALSRKSADLISAGLDEAPEAGLSYGALRWGQRAEFGSRIGRFALDIRPFVASAEPADNGLAERLRDLGPAPSGRANALPYEATFTFQQQGADVRAVVDFDGTRLPGGRAAAILDAFADVVSFTSATDSSRSRRRTRPVSPSLPASLMQQMMLFHAGGGPGRYRPRQLIELSGVREPTGLLAALSGLFGSFDPFVRRFHVVGGAVVQRWLEEPSPVPIRHGGDLSAAVGWLNSDDAIPADDALHGAALADLVAFQTGDTMLIGMEVHHALMDGVSNRILLSQIEQIANAYPKHVQLPLSNGVARRLAEKHVACELSAGPWPAAALPSRPVQDARPSTVELAVPPEALHRIDLWAQEHRVDRRAALAAIVGEVGRSSAGLRGLQLVTNGRDADIPGIAVSPGMYWYFTFVDITLDDRHTIAQNVYHAASSVSALRRAATRWPEWPEQAISFNYTKQQQRAPGARLKNVAYRDVFHLPAQVEATVNADGTAVIRCTTVDNSLSAQALHDQLAEQIAL